jgi:hypothetical protein
MSTATTIAAVAIFVATYMVLAVGKIPVYRIDRTGAALLGASLMVDTACCPPRRLMRNAESTFCCPLCRLCHHCVRICIGAEADWCTGMQMMSAGTGCHSVVWTHRPKP